MKKKIGGFFQSSLPNMSLCKAMYDNPQEYGLDDNIFDNVKLDESDIEAQANINIPLLTQSTNPIMNQSGGKYKKKETKKPKKETKKPKKETKKPKKETKKPKKETKKPKKKL
jgi:hypothetical protein